MENPRKHLTITENFVIANADHEGVSFFKIHIKGCGIGIQKMVYEINLSDDFCHDLIFASRFLERKVFTPYGSSSVSSNFF